MDIEKFIEENIGNKETLMYTIGEYGDSFGLYRDGSVGVGDSIGNEIAENERPLAVVKCIGISNFDMSYYRDDWENEKLSDIECIRDCFENGCVVDEIETLRELLLHHIRSRQCGDEGLIPSK